MFIYLPRFARSIILFITLYFIYQYYLKIFKMKKVQIESPDIEWIMNNAKKQQMYVRHCGFEKNSVAILPGLIYR